MGKSSISDAERSRLRGCSDRTLWLRVRPAERFRDDVKDISRLGVKVHEVCVVCVAMFKPLGHWVNTSASRALLSSDFH